MVVVLANHLEGGPGYKVATIDNLRQGRSEYAVLVHFEVSLYERAHLSEFPINFNDIPLNLQLN